MVSYALGVGGFLHELLVTTGERPYVLLGSLILLGGGSILLALDRAWR